MAQLKSPITERKMQVLIPLCLGQSNQQIADALSITEHSVRLHVRDVLNWFNVTNRRELMLLLIFGGIPKREFIETLIEVSLDKRRRDGLETDRSRPL